MSKKYSVLLLILALTATSGLPRGREIEELQLITALAADRVEDGIALVGITGVRAGEGEQPQVLTGQGRDMAEACQAVQEDRASRAYLGQADKLLLGEGLAREELLEVLEFVMDHRELRLDTLLYIVRGDAGKGLEKTAPETAGETPGRDKRGVSVGRVLSLLYEGEEVRVPALAPGEDGLLVPSGWAVLSGASLAGYTGDTVTASLCGERERYG